MAASVMAWSEKILPDSPRLVGRDEQGSAFIAGGDQLEQHAGLGLTLADIGDVVEDQQLVLVELGDGGFEPQLPARHLQPLDEIGGAGEQNAPAVLDESAARALQQDDSLPPPGGPKSNDIGAADRASCRRRRVP